MRTGISAKKANQSDKKQAYIDLCDRNAIEGVNGVLKRRYGLDLIMCCLRHNAEVEAQLQILAMNLQRKLTCMLDIISSSLPKKAINGNCRVFQ